MTCCTLCGAAAGEPFLVRADVPVHQNLPAPNAEAARAVALGRLEMVACAGCGFVFNRAFDAALPRYGPGYDNTQSFSPAFDAHLDGLARHLIETCGVRGARIVEVGCGQGDFLRRLVTWPGAGNTGVGYDPAHAGPETDPGGRLRFERRFYDADCDPEPADVVICRHVIEHVPGPLALLASVRAALGDSPHARVFFETPDVAWSLRHHVPWDFFYEHCSLFSAASLTTAFAIVGLAPVAVRHVFEGQYLWLEARPGEACAVPVQPGALVEMADDYGRMEAALVAAWRQRLAALAGKVAVWGAGAKGVTFAGLADPHGSAIDCVVDINPAKQGRFIPGTGHSIVGPEGLAARGVRHVVLMNPAYRAEVAARLPALGSARLAEWDV